MLHILFHKYDEISLVVILFFRVFRIVLLDSAGVLYKLAYKINWVKNTNKNLTVVYKQNRLGDQDFNSG